MNIKRHLFEYILDNHDRWKQVPTRSEIHEAFSGWSDDLDLHLEQLEREGLLSLGKDGNDEIALLPTFFHPQQISLQGPLLSVSRSCPDATEVPKTIALDLRGAGISMEKNLFALLVSDDSMSDAGIKPNDIAILNTVSPRRGEIVAVPIGGRMVLRRYIIVADIPHLLAENPLRPELLPAYEQTFHGVLWALVRTDLSSRAAPSQISYQTSAAMLPEDGCKRGIKSFLDERPKDTGERLISTGTRTLRGGVKNKKLASRRGGENLQSEWPAPPSGAALNETTTNDHGISTHKIFRDEEPERPYGQAHSSMLTKYTKTHR